MALWLFLLQHCLKHDFLKLSVYLRPLWDWPVCLASIPVVASTLTQLNSMTRQRGLFTGQHQGIQLFLTLVKGTVIIAAVDIVSQRLLTLLGASIP